MTTDQLLLSFYKLKLELKLQIMIIVINKFCIINEKKNCICIPSNETNSRLIN